MGAVIPHEHGRTLHRRPGQRTRKRTRGRPGRSDLSAVAGRFFVHGPRPGEEPEPVRLALPAVRAGPSHRLRYDRPGTPSGFCMLLRKHLESGTIRKVECVNADRVIRFTIENNNDFGERVNVLLIVEVMGKHANMVLTDAEGTIIDCYKRVSPFEERDRTFPKGFQ
ncbi:MAG: NFACT family protein [Bacillus subtilis]|nr:NFACT family protein [Bacillus subtilis]